MALLLRIPANILREMIIIMVLQLNAVHYIHRLKIIHDVIVNI